MSLRNSELLYLLGWIGLLIGIGETSAMVLIGEVSVVGVVVIVCSVAVLVSASRKLQRA